MRIAAIIVLAYGPGQVTKDAVERAQRLAAQDTEVVVVAATPAASRFTRRVRGPRVRVTDGLGRTGLEEAIASRGPREVVAVVHDDVLLTEDVLEALLLEQATSRAVVVPWNNDQQSDTSIGALPQVKRAEPAVRAAARDRETSERVHRVRPSCLVLDIAALVQLLPRRLTVARTALTTSGIETIAAAHAVVAHDSTCVQQVSLPRSPDDRPLVTAALIVRDEEELIGDCLASLEGFVDRIVVCDTGSSDATIDIAHAAGAEVIEREWRNDFGWARNEVLEQARDSWYVLQIDADERLVVEDPTELRRLLATDAHDTVGLTVVIENVDEQGRMSVSHRAPRLFRPRDVAYVGALHEMPRLPHGPFDTALMHGITLVHRGYTDAIVAARDKGARNVDIARREYDTNPSPVSALNLARSLVFVGAPSDELRPLFAEAADGRLGAQPTAHALGHLANLDLMDGNVTEAEAQARRALDLVPAEDLAALVLARINVERSQWDEVVTTWERRQQERSLAPFTTSLSVRAEELHLVARAHLASGDTRAAVTAIREMLSLDQPLADETWESAALILTLDEGDSAVETLLAAATGDATGASVEAIVRVLDPEVGARFALAVAEQGAVTPRGVRAGMVACLISGRTDLGEMLSTHAHVLDLATTEKLVETALGRGHESIAEALASRLLQGI